MHSHPCRFSLLLLSSLILPLEARTVSADLRLSHTEKSKRVVIGHGMPETANGGGGDRFRSELGHRPEKVSVGQMTSIGIHGIGLVRHRRPERRPTVEVAVDSSTSKRRRSPVSNTDAM